MANLLAAILFAGWTVLDTGDCPRPVMEPFDRIGYCLYFRDGFEAPQNFYPRFE